MALDLATFAWALSEPGQALLAETMAADLGPAGELRAMERLRRVATPERAAAIYELAWLRARAAAKFPDAPLLYFTREALEQSSHHAVAAARTARYAAIGAASIADLCCGVGGDALALARVAHVHAVDNDPLRLAMLRANAAALGLSSRLTAHERDLERDDPPHADAIFFDPARRADGRRVFALAQYRPSLALLGRWRSHTEAIGVKAAPGISDEDLATLGPHEAEFVSLDGDLKEAALWFGPLCQRPGRRATLLRSHGPGGWSMAGELFRPADDAAPQVASAPPQTYLYEPDLAVIRAHLVEELARALDATLLAPDIAYLSAAHFLPTPLARCWKVIEWHPFGLKPLRARLRALDAGPVTVKKRGSPLDTDALARQLAGDGARALTVALTQHRARPIMIICDGAPLRQELP